MLITRISFSLNWTWRACTAGLKLQVEINAVSVRKTILKVLTETGSSLPILHQFTHGSLVCWCVVNISERVHLSAPAKHAQLKQKHQKTIYAEKMIDRIIIITSYFVRLLDYKQTFPPHTRHVVDLKMRPEGNQDWKETRQVGHREELPSWQILLHWNQTKTGWTFSCKDHNLWRKHIHE